MTTREIDLVKASVGVAAGELASSAKLDRLQIIAADLKAADPTTQKLGDAECALLQARAKALGREAASELSLVVHDTDRIDRLSGELQGAVYCQPSSQFDPAKLAKLLGGDALAIEGLVQPGR
jgi:hypothetical protein